MKHIKLHTCLALAAGLLASSATADQLSPPNGYVKVDVLGNSDATISIPFVLPAVFDGSVSAVAGPVLTLSGASLGSLANTHFARITSGDRIGQWSTISANTATTITLADVQVAAGIVAGDQVVIRPHQTLNTALPAAYAGSSFIVSPSGSLRNTEVLELNRATVAINKSPVNTYYYINVGGTNVGWRRVGSPNSTDFGSTSILPDTYFILRNKNNSNSLPFRASGEVEMYRTGRAFPTFASVTNDMYVSTGRPLTLNLDGLGLGGTPAFETSPSGSLRKDQILVFNNEQSGQNKSPANTYYYINVGGTNVGWRRVGSPNSVDFGTSNVLQAASGFILRKTSGTAGTNDWSNVAPF